MDRDVNLDMLHLVADASRVYSPDIRIAALHIDAVKMHLDLMSSQFHLVLQSNRSPDRHRLGSISVKNAFLPVVSFQGPNPLGQLGLVGPEHGATGRPRRMEVNEVLRD